MKGIAERVQNIRVPLFMIVVLWLVAGWKFLKARYVIDAWVAAREYMREVKI